MRRCGCSKVARYDRSEAMEAVDRKLELICEAKVELEGDANFMELHTTEVSIWVKYIPADNDDEETTTWRC